MKILPFSHMVERLIEMWHGWLSTAISLCGEVCSVEVWLDRCIGKRSVGRGKMFLGFAFVCTNVFTFPSIEIPAFRCLFP